LAEDDTGKSAIDIAVEQSNAAVLDAFQRFSVTVGREELVAKVLDASAGIVSQEGVDTDTTVLHLASQFNHSHLVSLLCNRGIPPDATDGRGYTALMVAALNNGASTIHALVQCGACVEAADPINKTSLILAAEAGYLDAVTALLEEHADVEAKEATGHTALMCAAMHGHTAVITCLLEQGGADIEATDTDGYTTLMLAAACAQAATVHLLLHKGAAPDVTHTRGFTALAIAAMQRQFPGYHTLQAITGTCMADTEWCIQGWRGVVAELLDSGASVNAADENGFTPLMHATYWNNDYHIVEMLLQAGSRIESCCESGSTALSFVARTGDAILFRRLLHAGANASVRDNYGGSILSEVVDRTWIDTSMIMQCVASGLDFYR
jgi:ankyrin repeat protein